MQRRQFLKTTLSAAALSTLPLPKAALASEWVSENLTDDMPIAKITEASSTDFNGDMPTRPHDILWDVNGYFAKKGGEPQVSEEMDVVVVGGGVAGLTAAYHLRHKKVALIEQDARFGGNAKGEFYKDACYSIGSAYLCEPSQDSALGKLLTELDIWKMGRTESGDETSVYFQKSFKKPFWEGASDPARAQEFKDFHARMLDIYNNADFDVETSEWAQANDRITMEEWLNKEFPKLHPHIMEYLQLYGWSSFCGSLDELSALQYLGFITAETGSLLVFPGGNSYVLHKMVQKIRAESKNVALRSSCLVMRVMNVGDHVEVIYENAMGELKKIRAKSAILSCPKYVANFICPETSKDRFSATRRLHYRAYLVGNLFTKAPMKTPSYELYCLQGQAPRSPSPSRPPQRSFTDICFGSWAQKDETSHGVFTLYHGIAYDGARQNLFMPTSHQKYRDQYLRDIQPVLETLGLKADDIHGLRMTRWGHALPLAAPGLLVDGLAAAASASIGRIHFANQDNTMNPSFESAFDAAIDAVSRVE